jgi:hypothetical protein
LVCTCSEILVQKFVCKIYGLTYRLVLFLVADLQLCPAALVHFASRVTTGDTDYLREEWLLQASNLAGANLEASQHRRGGQRPHTGIRGEIHT